MNTGDRPKKSKPRFDTNQSAQGAQPDPSQFTYCLDESIGMKSIVRAMRDGGLNIKLVKEEFYEGVPDVEWLPHAIANGWILLAKDDRWRYRPAERDIIVNAGARAFIFVSKTAKAHEIAEAIVANINKLVAIAINTTPPFIAHMLLSGHVYVVFPADKRG